MHLACNELLREMNYNTLWVDEIGVTRSEPYVPPANREVTHIYDTRKDSIVTPAVTESLDIANSPNVFICTALNLEGEKELTAVVENNAIESPISIVNRNGRRIARHYEISEIASQEALDAFANRLAIESTTAFSHLKFGTALMPTHGSAETLLCIFPDVFPVPLRFHETAWEMPLTSNGIMTHEARRVVRI
jgi:hypothetical protein